jgi:hypothetical protein
MGSHWKLCSTSSAGLAAALLLFGCNLERSSSAEDSGDSPDSLTAAKSGCHPAECTPGFTSRGDIAPLAKHGVTHALFERLKTLDCSPHSVAPIQVFAEADPKTRGSRLFQYYLLDSKNFQPSVFTTLIKGVNDTAMLTSFGANCGLSTIGSVRLEVEPKPGLPSDPDDIRAFIDVFTDIRSLFVINNESGWYEGWMIHDLQVAKVEPCPRGAKPQFDTITPDDAKLLAAMGTGNNVPGHTFTSDGKAPHAPSPSDHFPDKVSNLVSLHLSMGAYNSLQQSDAHNYWEFNYTTNWIHPLYELPFTGGTDNQYQNGQISFRQSIVPGSGPGDNNRSVKLAVMFGDNPDLPRDPDKFDAEDDSQREFRERFIPSGIAHEALLNAFERPASFEPDVKDPTQRLLDGYKAAIALVDLNGDGIVSAAEGDPDSPGHFCPGTDDLTCAYLPARSYGRFAVSREINDGLLAPRFAPSTRGWVLSGTAVTGFGVIAASQGRDSDDR